jgi:hypothetical protein
VVRFTGVDPLNHPAFELAARGAFSLGFTLEVQTPLRGMKAEHLGLLREIRATLLLDVTDHLSHPEAARREQTQAVLSQTTAVLRAQRVSFGLEAHVGERDIAHLPSFAHFASIEGASAIHWYPRHCAVEGAMSPQSVARLYLLAKMVREASDDPIAVHLDLSGVRLAQADFRHLSQMSQDDRVPMADIVHTLIIDEGGLFWPFCADADAQWCITPEAPRHWRRGLIRWRTEGPAFLKPLFSTAAAYLENSQEDFISSRQHLRASAQPELVLEMSAA